MRIDSHQHFWKYDPVVYDWIDHDMERIKRDALPTELNGLLLKHDMDGCIAVQSEQNEGHNDFLLELSEEYDFIKGVVGWVDLCSETIEEKLDVLQSFPKLKGFRHILQGEPQRDFMLNPSFVNGLHALGEREYTYDILVYPDQLAFVSRMLKLCSDQKFVLDHLGKPAIARQEIEEWKSSISEMARFENVYCKLSGMVTEADWKNWTKDDMIPFLDVAVNAFGTDRLLFGSDWPVCLVAAEYEQVVDIIQDYFSSFSESEQQKIFGQNAVQFYNLKPS